jgi:hypothetical protein
MTGPAGQPGRRIEHGVARPCRWRVLIAVPPGGFGAQLPIMRAWLDATCGRTGWASAPAGRAGIVNDALAFYFADPEAARAFVGRFGCGYRPAPCRGL